MVGFGEGHGWEVNGIDLSWTALIVLGRSCSELETRRGDWKDWG
jgi:hypothetical protein